MRFNLKVIFLTFLVLFLSVVSASAERIRTPTKTYIHLQSTLQRIGYFDDKVSGVFDEKANRNVIRFIKDHNRITGDKVALKVDIYAFDKIAEAALSCILPPVSNKKLREKNIQYCFKLAQIQSGNNLDKIKKKEKALAAKVIKALSRCDQRLVIQPSQPYKLHWSALQLAIKKNRLMIWPTAYRNISLLIMTAANDKSHCKSLKRLLPANNSLLFRTQLLLDLYRITGKRAKEKELSWGKFTDKAWKIVKGR